MELTYVESLRRRWAVLGIDLPKKPEAAALPSTSDPEDESEEARRLVMEGAVVIAVIHNAIKGKSIHASMSDKH